MSENLFEIQSLSQSLSTMYSVAMLVFAIVAWIIIGLSSRFESKKGKSEKDLREMKWDNNERIRKLELEAISAEDERKDEIAKEIEAIINDISLIAGQKAVPTYAKKSVANFKLREGMKIGAKVTLRGEKMYEFMDRLFNFALPRVRDFKGINPNAFDGRGNYALGLKEQLIFPEIEYDKIDKIRGMDIVFTTTATTDEEARELLSLMGAPFAK